MKLTLRQFDLQCRHPFTTARDTTTIQKTLIVELEQDGQHGFGETPQRIFYGSSVDDMMAVLEKARPQIESFTLDDSTEFWPAEFWEVMRSPLGDVTFAQCALDVAAWDLFGKLRGQPVWRLWGLDLDACPPTDYTIGIDTIDVMVAKLQEFPGWPIYKIKLSTDNDLAIVRALRDETDAVFRIDANCGWTAEETIRNSHELKPLGVEFIEQPLPPSEWKAMERVYRESALPVVADESCQREEDVERCAGCFHGVNVKLPKCGGLTPARRMIARATELGFKRMVGCFTESSVGISGAAQLLPMLDYADLDGALLLAEDIATGVTIERGRVTFPDANGCGAQLFGANEPRRG